MSENHEELTKPSNIISFATDKVTHQVLSATLGSLNIPECIALEGDIRQAVVCISQRRSPRILIVDISNSDLPISDMRNLLEVTEPSTYLLVLGTRNDIGLFRDLMRLGVTDYITKPINIDFMSRSLLSIIQGGIIGYTDQRIGKVITFIGARGGVGTTTLATNVAWLLAHEKFKRTLLFDLDMHLGSSALSLDLRSESHFKNLMEHIDRLDDSLLEGAMQKFSDRLFTLNHQESIDTDCQCNPPIIEALLPLLRNQFHYVIVDMPRVINDTVRLMLRYTSSIFIVADPSLVSIRDTVRLIEHIGVERAKLKVMVILNKVGSFSRGEITRESFAKSIGHPVEFVLNFDSYNGLITANMGKPLASIATPATEGIRKIVDNISGTPYIDNKAKWYDGVKTRLAKVVQNPESLTLIEKMNKMKKMFYSFKGKGESKDNSSSQEW